MIFFLASTHVSISAPPFVHSNTHAHRCTNRFKTRNTVVTIAIGSQLEKLKNHRRDKSVRPHLGLLEWEDSSWTWAALFCGRGPGLNETDKNELSTSIPCCLLHNCEYNVINTLEVPLPWLPCHKNCILKLCFKTINLLSLFLLFRFVWFQS